MIQTHSKSSVARQIDLWLRQTPTGSSGILGLGSIRHTGISTIKTKRWSMNGDLRNTFVVRQSNVLPLNGVCTVLAQVWCPPVRCQSRTQQHFVAQKGFLAMCTRPSLRYRSYLCAAKHAAGTTKRIALVHTLSYQPAVSVDQYSSVYVCDVPCTALTLFVLNAANSSWISCPLTGNEKRRINQHSVLQTNKQINCRCCVNTSYAYVTVC